MGDNQSFSIDIDVIENIYNYSVILPVPENHLIKWWDYIHIESDTGYIGFSAQNLKSDNTINICGLYVYGILNLDTNHICLNLINTTDFPKKLIVKYSSFNKLNINTEFLNILKTSDNIKVINYSESTIEYLINFIIKSLNTTKENDFNKKFEITDNKLFELAEIFPEIGITKDNNISVISLLSTITDLFIGKRLEIAIDENTNTLYGARFRNK